MERDDDPCQQAWENEYEQWCAENDARIDREFEAWAATQSPEALDMLASLIRAVGDGTVYDMRNERDQRESVNGR